MRVNGLGAFPAVVVSVELCQVFRTSFKRVDADTASEQEPATMMKSSLDHIPPRKQRELARALEILHEEFEDALGEGTADFKKRGRILKIILFGSYARGTFVDEPHSMKGYRSDFDLLVIVNNRKLTDFAEYWYKAADRLTRDSFIETPTQFIVHSRREVNTQLKEVITSSRTSARKALFYTSWTTSHWRSRSR